MGFKNHLFAYAPSDQRPSACNGLWTISHPPSNTEWQQKFAFASNRNAYWDLYVLNLKHGQTTRITDTRNLDGKSPSWSRMTNGITYETMLADHMQINKSLNDFQPRAETSS